MFENMKMSKYNFYTYDEQGNLLIYNFLTGFQSLSKIMKNDVEMFKQFFLTKSDIRNSHYEIHEETIKHLRKVGILVDGDIDESIIYDAKQYEEIYNTKLTLTIFPTGKCNFRCPYCFEASQCFPRKEMTTQAQNAMVKFVQKQIPDSRAVHVSWFGGEPLLAPEIIKHLSNKFIQICSEWHKPYSADMVTNGYMLDAEMFDMLYKLKVYDYMITIDGFREQHDKQRLTVDGKGSYDVIINNLLKIRDNKQYRFANILIRINMTTGFLEKLDDFVNYIASLFVDDRRFKFMFVPVVKFSGSTFPDDDICTSHQEVFERLSKNDVYRSELTLDEPELCEIIPQQKCPAALKNSYVITPDLSVYKCNAHYDFESNKIGKINFKGDLEIDKLLHMKWYLLRRIIQKVPESCKECCYFPCCPNIDTGCPVSYLKATPEKAFCPMKDLDYKRNIVKSILNAASKYPCKTVIL